MNIDICKNCLICADYVNKNLHFKYHIFENDNKKFLSCMICADTAVSDLILCCSKDIPINEFKTYNENTNNASVFSYCLLRVEQDLYDWNKEK